MADNRVAAYLAEVRARSEQLLGPATGALPIANDAVHTLMKSAGDVPFLIAALEAVLKAHRPTQGGDGKDRCAWCRDYHGERSLWPCGEYLTISAELLGETRPRLRETSDGDRS